VLIQRRTNHPKCDSPRLGLALWYDSRILHPVKRAFLLCVALVACQGTPIGDPAGSNNYDDPDDPGQSGQNVGNDGGGDAYGRACLGARDCPAAFMCAYPIANMCTATGECLPYAPQVGCDASVACACDNTVIGLCAPSGYAPAPVQGVGTCDAGTVSDAAPEAASDAASD
jgi:hypothetical protein